MTKAPKDVARFDLTRGERPEEVEPHFMDFVALLKQSVEDDHPDTVTTVVLHSPRDLRHKPEQVNIYVFGTFKSHYRATEKLSKPLSKLYGMQGSAFPVIKPITRSEWRSQVGQKGKIYRDIKRRGIVLYDRTGG